MRLVSNIAALLLLTPTLACATSKYVSTDKELDDALQLWQATPRRS